MSESRSMNERFADDVADIELVSRSRSGHQFTDDQVAEIHARFARGESLDDIARDFAIREQVAEENV